MFKKIKSHENQHIKDILKILRSSKHRQNTGEFIVEGARGCDEVLKNKIKLKKLFLTEKFLEKKELLVKNLKEYANEIFLITDSILKTISVYDSPQGVVCVCKIDKNSRKYKMESSSEKIVILENIQNPSNFGAILRSCDAFGIKSIVISKNCCDYLNPKVISGAMGSIFRISIFEEENIPNFIVKLNLFGFKTFASVPDKKAHSILKLNFSGKIAVVIGNEGNGVTKETLEACNKKITIPIKNKTESLNAAVAASIIIFKLTSNQ